MAEFYRLNTVLQISLITLSTLAVAVQALNLVLSCLRLRASRTQLLQNLFEGAVLAQVFVCSMLLAQIYFSYSHGYIADSGYTGWRYVVFASLALAAIALCALGRVWQPGVAALIAFATLPPCEAVFAKAFPAIFAATLLFWLLRGVVRCVKLAQQLRTGISNLSVKQAIDRLPSGILFYKPKGNILLANTQMQRLMKALAGRVYRNGNGFCGAMETGFKNAAAQPDLDGQTVYCLPDHTTWAFAKSDILIGNQGYLFISAMDVTQHWQAMLELQRQNHLLQQRGAALKETLANIQDICRERVLLQAKNNAHDILGQRLTLLLRALQQEEALPADLLPLLSQELLDGVKQDKTLAARQELQVLTQTFAAIGVVVEFHGELPENEEQAKAAVEIVREAVTNAVRHALAMTITVRSDPTQTGHRIAVSNDGIPPESSVAEGSGIRAMRQRAQQLGGSLEIETEPRFKIVVYLPRGE